MGDRTERRTAHEESRSDRIFAALANNRRRYALYAIVEHDGPVSVHDLATTVAAWEARRTIPIVDSEQYDSVVLSLQHVHLPALANADLIVYDRAQEQVTLAELPIRLDALLDAVANLEVA